MGVRDTALKEILKRKLYVEEQADKNLNQVLQDEEIKCLFVLCKRLVVEIAKLKVDGKDYADKKNEYNRNREIMAELLKAKGIKKSDLRPKYSCEKCKDTGVIFGQDCDCLKKEMSKELIKLSGVDISLFPKFNNNYSVFENPEDIKCIYTKMKKFLKDISKTQIDTILIVGGTGVGKTYLLQSMTSYALESLLLTKYTTAFNFNHDMLRYHCSKLEDKEDIIDPYLKCDILFIDDLGTENKINNVTNEYLYMVLNERMQNKKKTVISTNLDLAQIQEVYGERIFSRLMHKKQCLKINFPGKDLRVGVKQKKED